MGTGISIAAINTSLVGIDTPVEDIGEEAIEAAIIVDESEINSICHINDNEF
jgi:hypothetical protein